MKFAVEQCAELVHVMRDSLRETQVCISGEGQVHVLVASTIL